MYAKGDKTFDALMTAMVRDWNELYSNGFAVSGFLFVHVSFE